MSVDGLEVKQMLDDGLHETTILAQRATAQPSRAEGLMRHFLAMKWRVGSGNAYPDARFAVAERVLHGGKNARRGERKPE